jgi:phosphatidylserine/phosphatidylglycerophosphate/cardiolipin synthase-like enzyme
VIIDQRFSVIGSMNLDLRSQLKNSEVCLLIRSTALAQQGVQQVENTLATAAYRLERQDGKFFWHAPPGAAFGKRDQRAGRQHQAQADGEGDPVRSRRTML